MRISVSKPVKTDRSYEFVIDMQGARAPSRYRIGLRRTGFAIRHHEIWDSILPLMHLTRNGGPLYNRGTGPAELRFDYPLSPVVADFYAERAREWGLEIGITAPRREVACDLPTSGEVLLFGGGKDSRLLLGTLRECGIAPAIYCAGGPEYTSGVPGAQTFQTFRFSMAERIVPALMTLPRVVYHGSGLGEVHQTSPWHQYYDISAPEALGQFSAMLARLGLDISFAVPQCVLPYNLVQKILARRYPGLYAGQYSVTPQGTGPKNLHVSLLQRYHGLPHDRHCSEDLFRALLDRFLARQAGPDAEPFGYRNHYKVISLEMRSIIRRLWERGDMQWLRQPPPQDWAADWIDRVHLYRNPGLAPALGSIYLEHAAEFDAAAARELPEELRRCLPARRGEGASARAGA